MGLAGGYLAMAGIGPDWSVTAAIAVTVGCAFFVHAGAGATYAIVPLVKRHVGGQIAGWVGACGNVGAVWFLTVLPLAGPRALFLTAGVSSLVAALACRWLPERYEEVAAASEPAPASVPAMRPTLHAGATST